ncbi:hypothetical protein [Tolypothrix sp. VBCCA 56010]|uniref:hypothetical protein n=1 Tax=Tolypothrix sp. VBCCA 56010 TaxID=3137731 RepID=UPI003D7CC8BF
MKKYYIPPNAPPPLRIEDCLSKRTQKDSADIKPTAKKLTFDDLEVMPKTPIRTRQGDSMTTSVNKVVNTSIVTAPAQIVDGTCRGQGAGNFAPIPQNYGHVSSDRQIASLPEDFRGNPNAVVIDAPQEIFRGLERPKQSPQTPTDMNALLPCGNGYAPIPASQLVNVNYKKAPPLIY